MQPTCSMCGGPSVFLGTVGDVTYFRCRNCGWGWGVWRELTLAPSCCGEDLTDRSEDDRIEES
jgi:hypothetical protein